MNPLSNDELISAYLDGELSGDELARAERLLADDVDSRRLLEELRSLRAGMESLPRHQLDADFARRVMSQAERAMISGAAEEESKDSSPSATAPSATAPVPAPPDLDDAGSWSRDRRMRMLLWPAVAVAAAVMVTMFLPNTGFEVVEHDTQAPMASEEPMVESSGGETAWQSEVTEIAPTESLPSPSSFVEPTFEYRPPRADEFANQAGARPADAPAAPRQETPEGAAYADRKRDTAASEMPRIDTKPQPSRPAARKPGAGAGGLSLGALAERDAARQAPPPAQPSALPQPTPDAPATLLRNLAQTDGRRSNIDAVAVVHLASNIGKETAMSPVAVLSRHRLVTIALPSEAHGRRGRESQAAGQKSRTAGQREHESSETSDQLADKASAAKKPASRRVELESFTEKKEQDGDRQAQDFRLARGKQTLVVEGTETQIRAALADLAGHSDGYRLKYSRSGQTKRKETDPTRSNDPVPAEEAEIEEGADADDTEADGADEADVFDEIDEVADAEESTASAAPEADDPVSQDAPLSRDGDEKGEAAKDEDASDRDGVARGGALGDKSNGGKLKTDGGERRIRVMIVLRTKPSPAEPPLADAEVTDEDSEAEAAANAGPGGE